MSNCYGCKFGLENQLEHLGGCLPNYDSESESDSEEIIDEYKLLKIMPNTRTNLNGCLHPHETKKDYQLKLFVKVDMSKYMAVLYTEVAYICREVSINNGKFEILKELDTIPNQLMDLI